MDGNVKKSVPNVHSEEEQFQGEPPAMSSSVS